MKIIVDWLSTKRHEPVRYKYDHSDDGVLVTVDFPVEVAAKAFAARFGGVHQSSPQRATVTNSRHIKPGVDQTVTELNTPARSAAQ
jgi:hypothetical protein